MLVVHLGGLGPQVGNGGPPSETEAEGVKTTLGLPHSKVAETPEARVARVTAVPFILSFLLRIILLSPT